MPTYLIVVDLFALAAIAAGFLIAFRQRLVRGWWRRWRPPAPDAPPPAFPEGQDPAHYAMIIFGMMLLAFGIIIFAFMTAFALFS